MKIWLGLLLAASASAQTKVWVDADTANEIDDLYAITRILQAKSFEVVALSSAQWKSSPLAEGNTLEQSQLLNEALLGLLGKDIPHPRGSSVPVYWWGRDRAAYSGAAYHLMLEARKMKPGERLTVVSLGAVTNVATALLLDPGIAGKLRLYWLGAEVKDGVWNKNEFNCLNDIHGLNVVLDAKDLDLHVMPANVSRALTFSYDDTAARLARKGRLGEFLLERWKQHAPGAASWVMWDLAAVEWLLHPEWVEAKAMAPPPENARRELRVATKIDAAKMREDFWAAW
jgi:inosine-uridine nucleoside N-ribohydrolase